MYEDVVDEPASEIVTIFIAKNPAPLANGLGQSFTVIAPEGYGMGIWRRLVYSGCKAIGEREYSKLMMECGRRVFPRDYPETNAGQEALMEDAVKYIENDYCLKPASKRINY
jgi:glycine cleavage system aminomethyltransferase T